MIFTFEHVNLGPRHSMANGVTAVLIWWSSKVFQKWEDGLEGVALEQQPLLDSHDQPETVSRFGNDGEEYREISAKMLATCRIYEGNCHIYPGEEHGMANRKCRDFSGFRDIEIKNAYRDFVGAAF